MVKAALVIIVGGFLSQAAGALLSVLVMHSVCETSACIWRAEKVGEYWVQAHVFVIAFLLGRWTVFNAAQAKQEGERHVVQN